MIGSNRDDEAITLFLSTHDPTPYHMHACVQVQRLFAEEGFAVRGDFDQWQVLSVHTFEPSLF
jgi:hypothetical protein